MIYAIDVIDRLPFELQARLAADEFFADIPVVVAEAGNLRLEMEKRTALQAEKSGKRGAAVIVLQVIADDESPEVDFGPMILRSAFQVIENVEMNRDARGTGKSARKIARRIRDVIKPLSLPGLTTDMVPEKPCIEPVTLAAELGAGVVAYQVNFRTHEADAEPVQQAASVAFGRTEAPAAVTLTCATAGAQIWYTTDDTYPAPPTAVPGSTAQLYTTPIDPSDETITIRACAYVAGMIASQVARAEIVPQ